MLPLKNGSQRSAGKTKKIAPKIARTPSKLKIASPFMRKSSYTPIPAKTAAANSTAIPPIYRIGIKIARATTAVMTRCLISYPPC